MDKERAEKEREISRMRAQQERAKDKQAERVSMCMHVAACTGMSSHVHVVRRMHCVPSDNKRSLRELQEEKKRRQQRKSKL